MRPIRLKISAFGPFVKTVDLDFEQGLNGENIFLIHGVTGAGKTSILDAICYALYDNSSGGDRKIDNLRSEQAESNNKTEVEFTFALGEKIFKIRRNPGYDMPRGTANVKKAAELYENGKLKTSNSKEVDAYIKNLLGFDVEQFRKVVLLPQGKFRDFLMANSLKRGEILNVIFDATNYAKIEQGLKDKSDGAKSYFDELSAARKSLLTNAEGLLQIQDVDEKNLPQHLETLEENLKRSKAEVLQLKNLATQAQNDLTLGEVIDKEFERFESVEQRLDFEIKELKKITGKTSVAKTNFETQQSNESQRKLLDTQLNELEKIAKSIDEFRQKKSELAAAEKAESEAKTKLSKLEDLIIKCESELSKLKTQSENLQGADLKLKDAEQNLKTAHDRQNRLAELDRLKKEFPKAKERLSIAEKNRDDARKNLNQLNLLVRISAAAKLAETLIEGEPCPVCGALHHPQLAVSKEVIPTDEEITNAENLLNQKEKEHERTQAAVTSIQEKIKAQESELQRLGNVKDLKDAEKFFLEIKKSAEELETCRKRLIKGEEVTKQKISERDLARKFFESKSKAAENLRGIISEQEKNLPPKYFNAPETLTAEVAAAKKLKAELDAAFRLAEKEFHELEKLKAEHKGKIKIDETTKTEIIKKISDKEKPNIQKLRENFKNASDTHSKAVAHVAKLEMRFNQLNDIFSELNNLNKEIAAAEKNCNIWCRLSEVASGKNNSKISFQRYYLSTMFQNIIRESNDRLYKMSGGRYQFKKKDEAKKGNRTAGLDIDIFDTYTGKARPVETLSGGESFLASLSLALGLAAVVKNTSGGINLDTIFIDEGFGSLDSETLDTAINTLEDLQIGGRLVGIISHVDELKQRIPARLEVKKTRTGSFANFN